MSCCGMLYYGSWTLAKRCFRPSNVLICEMRRWRMICRWWCQGCRCINNTSLGWSLLPLKPSPPPPPPTAAVPGNHLNSNHLTAVILSNTSTLNNTTCPLTTTPTTSANVSANDHPQHLTAAILTKTFAKSLLRDLALVSPALDSAHSLTPLPVLSHATSEAFSSLAGNHDFLFPYGRTFSKRLNIKPSSRLGDRDWRGVVTSSVHPQSWTSADNALGSGLGSWLGSGLGSGLGNPLRIRQNSLNMGAEGGFIEGWGAIGGGGSGGSSGGGDIFSSSASVVEGPGLGQRVVGGSLRLSPSGNITPSLSTSQYTSRAQSTLTSTFTSHANRYHTSTPHSPPPLTTTTHLRTLTHPLATIPPLIPALIHSTLLSN